MTNEFKIKNGIKIPEGSLSSPSIKFTGTNTGIYKDDDGNLTVAASGAKIATFSTEGMVLATGSVVVSADAPSKFADGTEAEPSITFKNDDHTGFYSDGNDIIGVTTGGTRRARITGQGILVNNGSASAPSHGFISDTNTGLYGDGSDAIGISTGGSNRLWIQNNGISLSLNGSASSPAFRINDSNTGLFLVTTDTLGFSTAGTERMRIDAAGRLGIGGIPTGKLTIFGTAGGEGLNLRDSGDSTNIAVISGDGSDNGRLMLRDSGGTTRINISSSTSSSFVSGGNFGINNTSPSTDLDVTGTFNVSSHATIGGNLTVSGDTFTSNTETVQVEDNLLVLNYGESGAGVTAGTSGIEVERGTVDNYLFQFRESDDTFVIGLAASLQPVATRQGSPSNGGVAFWDTTSVTFETENIFVYDKTNNRLGIGIASPEQGIHVVDTGGVVIKVESSNDNQALIEFENQNADIWRTGISSTSNAFGILEDSTIHMTVLSGGNVGIGTTSPDGELEVAQEGSDLNVYFTDYRATAGYGAELNIRHARGTQGTPTTLVDGDALGVIKFSGRGSSAWVPTVTIGVDTDGTISGNSIPSSLIFSTGSGTVVEAMRIDSSGNVGIGNSSLEAWSTAFTVLQIGGNAALYTHTTQGANTVLNLAHNMYTDGSTFRYTSTDEASLYQQEHGTHVFRVAASGTADAVISFTNAMLINNAGNVGIGSSLEAWHSIYTALQLGGNAAINAHTTTAASNALNIMQNAYYDSVGWKYQSTDEASYYRQQGGEHVFRVAASGTADAAITWVESLRIDNDGNVGIGTDSPSSYDSDADNLVIGTTTGHNGLTIVAGTVNNSNIYFADSGANSIGAIVYNHNVNSLNFISNAGTRMVIDNAGNVGIGETSPDEMLHLKSASSGKPIIKLENTNADNTSAEINFLKNSVSAADGDWCGKFRFNGLNDNASPETIEYGFVGFRADDISDGTEAGGFRLNLYNNGQQRQFITASGMPGASAVIINEEGQDMDFRVESDTSENGLVLIGSSGYVGMGTGPSNPLTVYNATVNNIAKFQSNDDAASIQIEDNDTTIYVAAQNGYLSIGGNSTLNANNLNVNVSNGNVGIGTVNPASKLHIADSKSSTTNPESTTILNIQNTDDTDNNYSTLKWKDAQGNDAAYIAVQHIDHANNRGELIFGTRVSGGNLAERMRIDHNGNVGIGNSAVESWHSSYTALQLGGTGAIISTTTPGAGNSIRVGQNYYNDNGSYKYIITDEASMHVQTNGTHYFRVATSGTADATISWTEGLFIHNSGNVGIGNSSLEAWDNGFTALQIDSSASILCDGSGIRILDNTYHDGAWKYQNTSPAGYHGVVAGKHYFYVAGSGTADTAITWIDAMHIDNSGRVGIGTSTPGNSSSNANNLVVSETTGNGGITILNGTSNQGSLYFADGTSGDTEYRGYISYSHSDDKLYMGSGAATAITLDSSQNVGIGTTSPDGSLHVHSGSAGTVTAGTTFNDLVVENSSHVGLTFLSPNTTAGGIIWGDSDNNARGFIKYDHGSNYSGPNQMYFGTVNTNAMTIDVNQRVGIGTLSPAVNLHVAKAIAVGGPTIAIHNTDEPASGETTQTAELQFRFEYTANSGSSFQNTYGARIIAVKEDDFWAASGYTDLNAALTFWTLSTGSGQEKMRLDSNGKLGIGLTNASSYNSGANYLVVGDSGVAGSTGMTIATRYDATGSLYFADGTSGGEQYRGALSYDHVNNKMEIRTNSSTRMVIDSAGNVGIGNSSLESWSASYTVLQIATTGSIMSSNGGGDLHIMQNAYYSDVWRYQNTAAAISYLQSSGKHEFRVAGSGTADTAISWTSAMVIDNAGRVGIGTSVPGNYNNDGNNLVIYDGSGNGGISIVTGTSSIGNIYFADGTTGSDEYRGIVSYNHSTDTMGFATVGSGCFQLTSTGRAQFSDGSAASPGISFINDTNTGIYLGGADSLGIVTGGSRRVMINGDGIYTDVSGSAATPSIRMNDTDTGFYLNGGNTIGLSTGGVANCEFNSNGLTMHVNKRITNQVGTGSSPSYSFGGDGDTGMYQDGGDIIGFATGGSRRVRITSQGILTVDGSLASPSHSFVADTNTGFYRIGSGEIGVSCDGTQSCRFRTTGLFVDQSGSAATPSIRINDANSGFYQNGDDNLGISIAGSKIGNFDTSGLLIANNGTAASPCIRLNDSNTGFFLYNTDQIGISTGGTNRVHISSSGIMMAVSGTAATPSIRLNESDTGIYLSAANTLAFSTNGAKRMHITGSGLMNWTAYGAGTVVSDSGGNLTISSDMNMKDYDGELTNALDKINLLEPKYYKWKEETHLDSEERQLGFYAQEVHEVIPEAAPTSTDAEGNERWGIYDRALVATLVKAVQELTARVVELESV